MPPTRRSTDLFDSADAVPPIRAGIGGWTFAPWRGLFYPEKWPQKRELEFAARQLPTIEVNGTFYGAQKPATYAKWRSETPDGFVFSLKAPRYCTDRRVLAEADKTVDAFVYGGLAELGDRLGPILWQFEPRHAFEPDDFARFLDLLPADLDGYPLRHVLEVRSKTFLCGEFLALARQHRFPCVFTDSPDSERMDATDSAARSSSGGRMPGSRRASIVLPAPGGPHMRR